MRYLKIAIGLLGIILFILTAVINLLKYLSLKKNGVRNVRMYIKTNPAIARKLKIWGYVGTLGFWMMIIASYMND